MDAQVQAAGGEPAATAYSGVAGIRRPKRRAAVKLVVAWALGKPRPVGGRGERRQSGQLGSRAAHHELERGVREVGDGDRCGAPQPLRAALRVTPALAGAAGETERQPARSVLAPAPRTGRPGGRVRANARGSVRAPAALCRSRSGTRRMTVGSGRDGTPVRASPRQRWSAPGPRTSAAKEGWARWGW